MRKSQQRVAKAAALGSERGKTAAGWRFDGNTSTETYVKFLDQIEGGDWEDEFGPQSPLSGEWADGLTVQTLIREVDPDGKDVNLSHYWQDRISSTYETAYFDAYIAEMVRVAKHQTSHLGIDREADDDYTQQGGTVVTDL